MIKNLRDCRTKFSTGDTTNFLQRLIPPIDRFSMLKQKGRFLNYCVPENIKMEKSHLSVFYFLKIFACGTKRYYIQNIAFLH